MHQWPAFPATIFSHSRFAVRHKRLRLWLAEHPSRSDLCQDSCSGGYRTLDVHHTHLMRPLCLGNCRLLLALLWEMYFRGHKQPLLQQKRVMWMKRLYWSWCDEAEHCVCECVWEWLLSLWNRFVFFLLFQLVLGLRNYRYSLISKSSRHNLCSHFCGACVGFEVVKVKWLFERMNEIDLFVFSVTSGPQWVLLLPLSDSSLADLVHQCCCMIYLGCV